MSKSYKKTPYSGEHKHCKKEARKIVRQWLKQNEIANGNAYKKIYNSWDICDYKYIESWEHYLNEYIILDDGLYHWKRYLLGIYRSEGYTYEELYWNWYKAYKMK